MSMMWVGIGSAVLGAGTSLYGANKQAKSNQAAQSANNELQREQNQSAWNSYLMSRGVSPNGATTGSIPTNQQAINAKLPLWANVTRGGGVPASMGRKRNVWRATRAGSSPASPAAASPAPYQSFQPSSMADSLLA